MSRLNWWRSTSDSWLREHPRRLSSRRSSAGRLRSRWTAAIATSSSTAWLTTYTRKATAVRCWGMCGSCDEDWLANRPKRRVWCPEAVFMEGALPIKFDPASLLMLNAILACMMFGVSLTLRPVDFKRVLAMPRAPVAGLVAQFLLLPAFTCLFTWLLGIEPELALGMILVSACPGGSFSNVMTWLGRGNVAVSVSMTAVSSLAATVLTPLNFALYGWLNPHTRAYLTEKIGRASCRERVWSGVV